MQVVSEPGISIIFPVYNEEKIIETTLKHYVRFRERYKLEIIIADDNSTDQTLAKARKYADKIVLNPTNTRGRSANCNRGASIASSDILLFLDADIRIADPERFFQTAYHVFQHQRGWIGGMINHRVYPGEEILSDKITHITWNLVMRFTLVAKYAISTPGFQMVTRTAFQRIGGFDERLGVAQDIDFSLRLSKIGRIYFFKGLHIWESPRRYRKRGYIGFILKSSLIWLHMLLRHRSYGEYEIIR